MTAIVSVETVLLVILVVLVAGLLRSHAEILRRLGPADGTRAPNGPAAPHRPTGATPPPIAGATPRGDAIALDLDVPGTPTLLAFLSTGCSTCAEFWPGLAAGDPSWLPAGVETVVVTHGADRERPARLRELAPADLAVVMSSQAWEDYAVPGSPYFVLVDGAIRGEGVASSWPALASLVTDAIADRAAVGGSPVGSSAHGTPASRSDGTARAHAVERKLAAAGIGPDHPSLHPADLPGGPSPQ